MGEGGGGRELSRRIDSGQGLLYYQNIRQCTFIGQAVIPSITFIYNPYQIQVDRSISNKVVTL